MSALVPTSSLDTLVAAFLAGRSSDTFRAYRRDLFDFQSFAGPEALTRLLGRGPGEANAVTLAYKAHLFERGLQPATINRRLAALRSLVKLARTLGYISFALDVQNTRLQPYRDTRGPGREGFRKMLAALDGDLSPKAVRDRAILRLLYDLALRRKEVVSLDVAHVDLTQGSLSVLGKGRTQRDRLTLPEPTQAALEAWLAVRGWEPGPLFTNFDRAGKGQRLTGTAVYLLVRELGQRCGFAVRPHGLRHAGITAALDLTGGNFRAVQRFSRHKDPRILTFYDDNRADLAGQVARLVAEEASQGEE